MPVMSTIEQAFCRSMPWRSFSRRVAFPWALDDSDLSGDVLEIGAGAGAMAVELLDRYPAIRLVATDVDARMRADAQRRLAGYGDRVRVCAGDATALPFAAGSFDAVLSFIMLHHVIDWEQALAEAIRVMRTGGVLAGYDLVDTRTTRLVHRLDRSPHRLARPEQLRTRLAELPVDDVSVSPALGGLVVRFHARRMPVSIPPTTPWESPP